MWRRDGGPAELEGKARLTRRVRLLTSRCSEVLHETRNLICRLLARRATPGGRLLDVGCWDGAGTISYGTAASISRDNLYGIDVFNDILEEARKKINAFRVDLERDSFPFPTDFFDIVVCNQVFEHLKNIYLPMTEICRVLKPGGLLVFSVPNLATLHNRALLLLGFEPTSIRVFGPHVRVFTLKGAVSFLTYNNFFHVERVYGVGLYPFAASSLVARIANRCFPGLAHTIVLELRNNKAAAVGANWLDFLRGTAMQTNFAGTERVGC